MVPKFHYSFHLPRQVRKFGWACSCFVHERKHKLAKRFGNAVRNTSAAWEKGVLRDCTATHVFALRDADPYTFDGHARLQNPRPPKADLRESLKGEFGLRDERILEVSARVRINEHETCSVRDVVLLQVQQHGDLPCIGQLLLTFSVDAVPIGILRQWPVPSTSAQHWKCRADGQLVACFSEGIACSLIWAGTDVRTVLKPSRVG